MTTTTDLITTLQVQEFGGFSGKPRELIVYAIDDNGDKVCVMDGKSSMVVSGAKDGTLGTELELTITGTQISAVNDDADVDRFVMYKMMDAISVQCGRSAEDKAAMLGLLSQVLAVADQENMGDKDIVRQLRNQFEDLS